MYVIFNQAFWKGLFTGEFHYVSLNVTKLIQADFSAGAVLITFGALIGKVSAFQMCLVAIFEPIFYNFNEHIGLFLEISDMGGSIVIHAFGAFFGLAATKFLTPSLSLSSADNSAVYHSDMFAMIGTIFLWIFWPSFNGALAIEDSFVRAIVNTVIALTGSCVCAFVFSYILREERKFCMVEYFH
jgi:ammonium transporter Rh